MLFVVSPSKTMTKHLAHQQEAQVDHQILELLQSLDEKALQSLLKVNDSLAKLNYERYQNFVSESLAIYSYTGPQFQQLTLNTYNDQQWYYLNEHVRIISALYGLVKPLECIALYRLEMNSNLKIQDQKLSVYWQKKLLNPLLNTEIINLASDEYSKVLNKNLNVVTIYFMEVKNDKLVTVKDIKKCRGKFLNQCIKENIYSKQALYKMIFEDFELNSDINDNKWYFIKRNHK